MAVLLAWVHLLLRHANAVTLYHCNWLGIYKLFHQMGVASSPNLLGT